ncbi:phage tail protein [Intestinibacillus massiliensis]|uniref:phage tail protein n=1 Tax=Intestinibacillus massiliensis TaxID=1871029 RepID=UPI000B361499|nr:phage tail protein [Intestinibacillus massiliensis]
MISLQDARITDVLPPIISSQPWVQAYAFAVQRQVQMLIRYSSGLSIWNNDDGLPDKLCDALALELRTPQYRPDLPLPTKRNLVRNTLTYYALAGTKSAVEHITSDIFGSAGVQEWFQYAGKPGYFKVTTDNPAVTDDNVDEFKRVAESVKRLSAHLEKVELSMSTGSFVQQYSFSVHSATKHTISMDPKDVIK